MYHRRPQHIGRPRPRCSKPRIERSVIRDLWRPRLEFDLDLLGAMSVFWHKADIPVALTNVRFGGKADIVVSECHVCF
jgi:hypothetical protein